MLDQTTRQAILTLHERGHGKRAIAKTLGISRNSVRDVLGDGRAAPPPIARTEQLEPVRDEILARLARSEERIQSLVHFLADGERSEAVTASLRDLEAQAKAERAAIERLQREAQSPPRLPSPYEVVEAVFRFDAMLAGDLDVARSRLRRWIKGGVLRVARVGKGFEVRGACFPLALLAEDQNIKSNQGLAGPESNFQSAGALESKRAPLPLVTPSSRTRT